MGGRVFTVQIRGFAGGIYPIDVSIQRGLPSFRIIGLPSGKAQELKEKVYAGYKATGLKFPDRRVRIQVRRMYCKDCDDGLGLPIALAIYLATINSNVKDVISLGNIHLDGSVSVAKGASVVIRHINKKFRTILPTGAPYHKEACYVTNLRDAINSVISPINYQITEQEFTKENYPTGNLNNVLGLGIAKRALQIALAGGHSLYIRGAIGTGKTRLLQTAEELLTYRSRSVINDLYPQDSSTYWCDTDITKSSLIYNNNKQEAGIILRGHQGLVIFDEFPLVGRGVKEQLLQILDTPQLEIEIGDQIVQFNTRSTKIFIGNYCPCGKKGNKDERCKCSQSEIESYQRRISGPLLNRIDMHVNTDESNYKLSTEEFLKQIIRAEAIQNKRYKKMYERNAYVEMKIDNEILQEAKKLYDFNYRDLQKIMQIAQTIADLDNSDEINQSHIYEAISYRSLK